MLRLASTPRLGFGCERREALEGRKRRLEGGFRAEGGESGSLPGERQRGDAGDGGEVIRRRGLAPSLLPEALRGC